MNNYLEKISKTFSNPFLLGLIIIFILNLMIIFTLPAKKKKTTKMYFRSAFYQYILITFILYLHHNSIESEYKKKYESDLNLNLVSRVGSGENIIKPDKIDIFSTEEEKNIDNNEEDEFI